MLPDVEGKGLCMTVALLTWVRLVTISSTLQSQKWQLTDMS